MLALLLALVLLLTPHDLRVLTVWEAAVGVGVDPELAVRVSIRENRQAIPDLWSPTGCCVGLMQVNVDVHLQRYWGVCMRRHDAPWAWAVAATVEDLKDPQVNACYGVHILKEHLRMCNGEVRCALRGYVGGEVEGYVEDILGGL